MRETFTKELPPEIAWRKDKIGYEPPQKNWMETGKMEEILANARQKLIKDGIIAAQTENLNLGNNEKALSQKNKWKLLMATNLV